jgi:hypothetical protein
VFGTFGISDNIEASNPGTSFVWWHDAGKHAHGCRLTSAIWAHKAKDFARANVKAEMIDGLYPRELFGESLDDDRGLGHGGHYFACVLSGRGVR